MDTVTVFTPEYCKTDRLSWSLEEFLENPGDIRGEENKQTKKLEEMMASGFSATETIKLSTAFRRHFSQTNIV